MPPATRISSYKDSGGGGAHDVFFCSAGTTASIINVLEFTMQTDGWSIAVTSASTFSATKGGSPRYRIDVNAANPSNYFLRIYDPS